MLLPFFYHIISDDKPAHVKHLYPIKTVKEFETDLEYLLKNFEPFDPANLPNRKKLSKPQFLLTFDDGMQEVGDIIAPILQKKGVPAIFFVCRDFARKKSIFYKHIHSFALENQTKNKEEVAAFLNKLNHDTFLDFESLEAAGNQIGVDFNPLINSKLYLNESEILALSKKGFMIGGHSLNHPNFSKISDQEGQNQILECMKWVVSEFQPDYKTFAFPFADYFLKLPFFEGIENHSFSPDFLFGTSEGKEDEIPYSIQRIDAEKKGAPIEYIIKNYRRKKFVRKLIGMNKIRR